MNLKKGDLVKANESVYGNHVIIGKIVTFGTDSKGTHFARIQVIMSSKGMIKINHEYIFLESEIVKI